MEENNKEELIKAWQVIRRNDHQEWSFMGLGLKDAVRLVNRTFELIDKRVITWEELADQADVDETDAAFLIRRSLYAVEVSFVKAKFVIVSINEEGEYFIECFQEIKEKAEEIAALLRSCSLFFDIQVMAMQEYLDIVEEETEVFSEETEMAFKSLMKS